MRVSTAFNRVLALPGATVVSVSFTDEGIVVAIRARARVHRCPCGWSSTARYDVRRRRWRHLDLAGQKLWLEADLARIDCHACEAVRTEDVAWARPGAKNTTAVEDTIAWLAQRMDKTAVADLMRVAWKTVDDAISRLVAQHLDPDLDALIGAGRLDGLTRIGVDEISHRRGHAYLTVIADHDTGRVVWVSKTRTQEAFEQFITALGPQRCARIEAVTMDVSPIYRPVVERTLPGAQICFDPFHVIKWANEALDSVYAATRTSLWTPTKVTPGNASSRKDWRKARFILRRGAENLPEAHRDILTRLHAEDQHLARAWELKEGLRDLYKTMKTAAPEQIHTYLNDWCNSAAESGISPFTVLARRIRRNLPGIAAAVIRGLSNSRLEGINAKIRVIQRRGYGHQPDSLIAMIHLCLGGIHTSLPTRT